MESETGEPLQPPRRAGRKQSWRNGLTQSTLYSKVNHMKTLLSAGSRWSRNSPRPRRCIDRRFKDGDTIRVGPLALTAHVTAGHTPGCTSWEFPVRHGDRELRAVSICGVVVFPSMSLVEPETYPGIRADFERSFRTLRSLPAGIFLAQEARDFNMRRKRRERANAKDPADPFIDREGYLAYIDRAEKQFREQLANQLRRR